MKMTVEKLIKELQKIEDKSAPVIFGFDVVDNDVLYWTVEKPELVIDSDGEVMINLGNEY